MKVAEMMASLHWGVTDGWRKAHIMVASNRRAECGIFVRWLPVREHILDQDVCKRCLKATEKYA